MIRRAAALFALAGALLLMPGPAAGEEEVPELNTRLRLQVLHTAEAATPQGSASEAIRRRQAMSLLVHVPAAQRTDGTLLDPASVRFEWNGAPLESFVYYHHPLHGVAFVLLDDEAVRASPQGELTATGHLLGDEEPAAGWRLPMDLTEALAALEAEDPPRRAQAEVVDGEGRPIAGARLFGQGVAGIYGVSGDDGRVALAAEARDISASLHVWAEGHWPRRTELLHGRRIVLDGRDPEDFRPLDVYLESTLGVDPGPALLDLELGSHTVVEGPGPHRLELPPEGGARITAIVPGHQAATADAAPGEQAVRIVLEPLPGLWQPEDGEPAEPAEPPEVSR